MTFAEIHPHLAAGTRVRRTAWPMGRWTEKASGLCLSVLTADRQCATMVDTHDLLASDWELVDEPGTLRGDGKCAVHEYGQRGQCSCSLSQARATIARLTRELAEAKQRPMQCMRDLPGTAWVCKLPKDHQGSHANSFGTWRP